MDTNIAVSIISTSGAVTVGIFGMWISASQTGKRIDDLIADFRDLRHEFNAFKDVVNGKLSTLDLEIAKLLDRGRN